MTLRDSLTPEFAKHFSQAVFCLMLLAFAAGFFKSRKR